MSTCWLTHRWSQWRGNHGGIYGSWQQYRQCARCGKVQIDGDEIWWGPLIAENCETASPRQETR